MNSPTFDPNGTPGGDGEATDDNPFAPLTEAERAQLASYEPTEENGPSPSEKASGSGGGSGSGGKPKQSEKLLDAVAGIDLFHTPKGEAYATFSAPDGLRTAGVGSTAFEDFLRWQFYSLEGKPPGSQALIEAQGVLSAEAKFTGPERDVHLRVAGDAGRVYVDLANRRRDVVEIDTEGWRIIAAGEAPVRFRRTPSMQPLPRPQKGGSGEGSALRLLRKHVRAAGEGDFALLLAFLVGSLSPSGPYPLLCITGEQGSGKTTAAKMVRALLDPSEVPTRSRPRKERDLIIAAENGRVLSFNNMSGVPPWLSDALCRISHGGGFGVRRHYSDREEIVFHQTRPVVLNGIERLATRPDLADRAVCLRLEAIPPGERQRERLLWEAFRADRPRILGALFMAVSAAVRNVDSVELNGLPRMADFAAWAAAAEEAFPVPQGAFMKAYQANRRAATESAAEADSVASAVCSLLPEKGNNWTGKTSNLLEVLREELPNPDRPPADFPDSYQALAARMDRARPVLRELGIQREDDPRSSITAFTLRRTAAEGEPARAGTGAGGNPAEKES